MALVLMDYGPPHLPELGTQVLCILLYKCLTWVFFNGVSYQLDSLGVCLRLDDNRLSLLFGLVHKVFGLQGLLSRDLLLLHGLLVLRAESDS